MTNTPTAMERARELLADKTEQEAVGPEDLRRARALRDPEYLVEWFLPQTKAALRAIIAALSAPLSPRPDLAGQEDLIENFREAVYLDTLGGNGWARRVNSERVRGTRAALSDALQQLSQSGETGRYLAALRECQILAGDGVEEFGEDSQAGPTLIHIHRVAAHAQTAGGEPVNEAAPTSHQAAVEAAARVVELSAFKNSPAPASIAEIAANVRALRLPADPPAQPVPVGDARLREALEAWAWLKPYAEVQVRAHFDTEDGPHWKRLLDAMSALTPPAPRAEMEGE